MTMPEEARARLVVEAVIVGDAKAAANHGVSVRTLQRARKALASDEGVTARIVAARSARAEIEWGAKVNEALVATCDFIERAAEELDPSEPSHVKTMARALGMLAEVQQRKRILDERLGE